MRDGSASIHEYLYLESRKSVSVYYHVCNILLLLSSDAQELSVLWRAPSTPYLAPDTHRHRRSHAQHDHDAVESKDWSHASSINEVLQRLVDGEVDARGADGKDDNNLARDLLFVSAVRHAFRVVFYSLLGSNPLRMQ